MSSKSTLKLAWMLPTLAVARRLAGKKVMKDGGADEAMLAGDEDLGRGEPTVFPPARSSRGEGATTTTVG